MFVSRFVWPREFNSPCSLMVLLSPFWILRYAVSYNWLIHALVAADGGHWDSNMWDGDCLVLQFSCEGVYIVSTLNHETRSWFLVSLRVLPFSSLSWLFSIQVVLYKNNVQLKVLLGCKKCKIIHYNFEIG